MQEGISQRRFRKLPFKGMQTIRHRAITPRKPIAHIMQPTTSRKRTLRRESVAGGTRWATVRTEPCRTNDRGQARNEAATPLRRRQTAKAISLSRGTHIKWIMRRNQVERDAPNEGENEDTQPRGNNITCKQAHRLRVVRMRWRTTLERKSAHKRR